ncbi:immunoglobulin-like domain-containing protein [Flavivirga algicola]|uniref:DUF5011 domain-containing protein n=1 Tax=Flavivirga algicola TaxID=2729136 RepID=A0ABX1S2G4_9FLAO|nr:immunoglobulin-like domain-containing protein [Flavivirga algicola]NMH89248.1 DUF5011 domain-containing protein [Flavivirga algicola]
MPKKSIIKKSFLLFLICLSVGFIFYLSNEKSLKDEITKQREQHAEFMKNSPFIETLTWDKKTRKQKGLPPNRYFEQMWELTINPGTGKLDVEGLTNLREQLKKERKKKGFSSSLTQRNPGNAANVWEERGPNNVGGRTRVIMFDPNDTSNNTVYAGGVSGGLWKNTNISSSTSTWTRIENVPGNLSVTSITVDPRNSNIWYVGTGEQYTAGDVVGNGVYVTTDGGTTWSAINIPPADSGDINFSATNLFLSGIYYVNDILAWDNGTSTELFVAVGAHAYGDSSSPTNWLGLQSSGLYRSTNGGATWSRIESANMQHTFGGLTYYYIPNDLEVGADNKLWMGTIGSALGEGGGRVFSSTNGSIWTEAAASPLTDSNRVELEPSATNANTFYALTQGVASPVHIYSTTNGFASISSTSLPNDADPGIAANDFCRDQAFYNLVIETDPSNDNIVYVGGIDLFKTTNGGTSWSQLSHWYGGFGHQEVHADQHAIAFGNNSSSQIMFGNDGGLYYSGNSGSTISVRNNNYNVTQFVKAGIGPDGTGDTSGIFSAGAQDNGTQAFRNATTGVNSSEELSDGDGFYTFVDKDGQYMIASYVFNVIYRFNLPWNGLGRINGAATTLSNSQTTGDFVNQMGYDSDANRLLSNNSSGTNFSIRSINVAANSSGTLTNAALTAKPTAFRASPFATNTWYVGTATGGLLRLTNVSNSSATWTTITTPFVGSVSSIRFGETSNDLIVTMHNYGVTSVWYSSNAGTSWSSKEGNLPNIPVRDFLLNPLNLNEAIIATQLGVWETSDFNATSPTWSQAYNGMSDVSVTSFDYWDVSGDDTTNKVIASTYGRGVFTGSFTATSIPDTEAPTAPTNLIASTITQTSVDLSWTASTDNIGVTGYDIYQDGSLITNVSSTTYQVTGLSANTAYDFTVRAKDAAENVSVASNEVNITTLAPGADTVAPVITLNGDSTINLTVGDTYTELGATATDNVDGDLTSSIVIGGSVNTTIAGSYFVTYDVSDAAGNAAAQVTRTIIVNNQSAGPTTLHEVYFETGWDGWIDGGSDCARYRGSRSYEGRYSIRLRDNSGTASAMTSPIFDITAFNQVEVKFYFYAYSMENGEDFWLSYYNGSTWTPVATYVRGTHFNNNTFYSATVVLDASTINFVSNAQYRFQCDASSNSDYIYIDQITIIGNPTTSPLIAGTVAGRGTQITPLRELNTDDGFNSDEEFMLYPNPVNDNILNIRLPGDISTNYRILNMLGQRIASGTTSKEIDVSNLNAGAYFLEVNDGEEIMIKKFVKR